MDGFSLYSDIAFVRRTEFLLKLAQAFLEWCGKIDAETIRQAFTKLSMINELKPIVQISELRFLLSQL